MVLWVEWAQTCESCLGLGLGSSEGSSVLDIHNGTHVTDCWHQLLAGGLAGAVNKSSIVCVTSPFGLHFSKYGSCILSVEIPRS